jgi:hypothetical protein
MKISKFLLTLIFICTFTNSSSAEVWNSDGNVNKIIQGTSKDKVFLAGDFWNFAPASGSLVAINKASNTVDPNFPKVMGNIYAMAPDGNGGFFIGGDFTQVADFKIKYLAHILSNKTVDRDFNLDLNSIVTVLHKGTNLLYIAGFFTELEGQNRYRVGAINLSDLSLNAWSPRIDSGYLEVIYERAPTLIYIGGSFTTDNSGSEVKNLALVNDNSTYLPWYPRPNRAVRAIVHSSAKNTVYVGGEFSEIHGGARDYFASFDNFFHTLLPLDINVDDMVGSLALDGNDLYLGGGFYNILGQGRKSLAKIDLNDNSLTDFSPDVRGYVASFDIDANNLYVVGFINSIGNDSKRRHFAAFNKNTGALIDRYANFNRNIEDLVVLDNQVLVGGNFTSSSSEFQQSISIAELNTKTEKFSDFDPKIYGSVYDLKLYDGKLYAVGYIYAVADNEDVKNFVVVDAKTGEALSTAIRTDNRINTIEVTNKYIFIGGVFNTVNNVPRKNFAVLKRRTLELVDKDFLVDGEVKALKYSQGRLFMSGQFTSVSGQEHLRLAALNLRGLKLNNNWRQTTDREAYSIEVLGRDVYLAGIFNKVAGFNGSSAAIVNFRDGSFNKFISQADQFVYSLSIVGHFLNFAGYVGYRDLALPLEGENIIALAQANLFSNTFIAAPKKMSTYASAIFSSPKALVAGGGFFGVNSVPQKGISIIEKYSYKRVPKPIVEVSGRVATISFNTKRNSSSVVEIIPIQKNKREFQIFTDKDQVIKKLPRGKYKVKVLNSTNTKKFFESRIERFEVS